MRAIFCKNVKQTNAKTNINFIPHEEYLLAKQKQNTFTTQTNTIKQNQTSFICF